MRKLSSFILIADDGEQIICMGQVALVLYVVHLGAGKHVVFLHDIPAYAKSIIAMECLYCIGTASFKFSALLLFHRIFGSVPRFTALLWSLAVLIIANNVAEIFLSVFQCTPVNKAWDPTVPGSCVDIILAACIPGAINVLSDFITVLLPMPLVWGLQMPLNRKIQLVAIFLLSGFVCIASTYRTVVVKRLSHQDASWADVDPAIWAVVENAIGIVSASLPTMRPLYVFLVRGHYCSVVEAHHCQRCTARNSKESGSTSAESSESRGRANDSYSSGTRIVEKGDAKVATAEIV